MIKKEFFSIQVLLITASQVTRDKSYVNLFREQKVFQTRNLGK